MDTVSIFNHCESYPLEKIYNVDKVFEQLDCTRDNPNYESYRRLLMGLIDEHINAIMPVGFVVVEKNEGQLPDNYIKIANCLVSIGPEIDKILQAYFNSYNYLEAMMMNALGDCIIYEASNQLYGILKKQVTENRLFLSNRLEPGNNNIALSEQKVIYDKINAKFKTEIEITSGFMLSPSKTLAYFYGISQEACSNGLDHDCTECSNLTCRQRRFILKIYRGEEISTIQAQRGENLYEVLRRNDIFIAFPCSGSKFCGKCKVIVKQHEYALTEGERTFLTEEEIREDVVLSCYHKVNSDMEVVLNTEPNTYKIQADYEAFHIKEAKYLTKINLRLLGVAVDIGTTTVVISLVDLAEQRVVDTKKVLNPQIAFGADVISRIMYAAKYKNHKLGQMLRDTIQNEVIILLRKHQYSMDEIQEMVVSGNTTMAYLLLDLDPRDLGVYPFKTVDIDLKKLDSEALFYKLGKFTVTIIPWVSAYVGGDIVSGIFSTDLLDEKKNILYIDIGTNAEIVLRTPERLISAASAAGPAFEGANIRCGIGSVEGAICEASMHEDGYIIKTIGNAEPIGICGTGLVDAVAALLKQGHVSLSGYMPDSIMLYKDIGIYPEDIRQVQLAKAAVMAGIDVLLSECSLSYGNVDVLYIAGGFGSELNIENASAIGLIPKVLVNKVKVVGNTSLGGSIKYLLDKQGNSEVNRIINTCEHIELSTNLKFNEAYVMRMGF